jgi:S-adenosylmethionine/arginine decarboxylase-like enzyme
MVKRKTRKNRTNRPQNIPGTKVQHHHLLMRVELQTCPKETEKERVQHMIQQIIQDINMKSLAAPHVYYRKYPRYNEGLTGIAPIETSHIAFHFWARPDPKILHTSNSNCLLEFDVYTCGSLSVHNVAKILHHLTQYKPTYIDITILNRNTGLQIERHMHWNSEAPGAKRWAQWLDSDRFE